MSARAPQPSRIHVLGAGGVGLSAVALLAADLGLAVTASDLRASPIVERVRAAGIELRLEPWPEAARDADWLVAPASLPPDHPELAAALDAGRTRLGRDEALAALLGDTPCLAVTGTLTRSAAALALAELLGGAAAGIGLAVGALPRDPAHPHVRAAAPGRPMVVELDERAPLPPFARLEGLLVSDLIGPALGYEPRSFPQARAELGRAALEHGAWYVRPLVADRDDSPELGWQFVDAEGFSGAALRARPWAGTVQAAPLELRLDRGPSARLETEPGDLNARALAAAVAGAVLGCGADFDSLADRLARDPQLHAALEIAGQLDIVARAPLIVHDVRTWPVAVAQLLGDRGVFPRMPALLTRPYPPTLNASPPEDVARAHAGAHAVVILPPYPGGRGDEDARLAALLGELGAFARIVRVTDEDEAIAVARALHTREAPPWLCLGGDDMARLAERLAGALENC